MKKKIHFFESYKMLKEYKEHHPTAIAKCDYHGTQKAIEKGETEILTIDIASMQPTLISDYGYQIYLHQINEPVIRIQFKKNDWTRKKVDLSSDLVNMFRKGYMRNIEAYRSAQLDIDILDRQLRKGTKKKAQA